MNIPLVDLKAQYAALKPQIDAAIAAVIADTAFVGNMSNRFVQKFEAKYAAYIDAKHAIACANATDALENSLKADGIGVGGEVLVPAVPWIATLEAVRDISGKPVFVDIFEDSCCHARCGQCRDARQLPA
jgi:dTDP-4-amino-4,6-dideoxygalactose transaminase